jgi:hypothetical protein
MKLESDAVQSRLRRLHRDGVLESDQEKALLKAIRLLDHSIKTNDVRRVRKAVSSISRVFLRNDR